MAYHFFNPGYGDTFPTNVGDAGIAAPGQSYYANGDGVIWKSKGYGDTIYIATPQLKEIWAKFTMWITRTGYDSNNNTNIFCVNPTDDAFIKLKMGANGNQIIGYMDTQELGASDTLIANTPYEVKIHAKLGKTDGIFEVFINDKAIVQYEGQTMESLGRYPVITKYQLSITPYMGMYNILVADTNIFDEKITYCIVKDVSDTGNFTDAEQTLSGAIDVNELKERIKTQYGNPQISYIGFSIRRFSVDFNKVNAFKARLTLGESEKVGDTNKMNPQNHTPPGCPAFLFDVPTLSVDRLKDVHMFVTSKKEP